MTSKQAQGNDKNWAETGVLSYCTCSEKRAGKADVSIFTHTFLVSHFQFLFNKTNFLSAKSVRVPELDSLVNKQKQNKQIKNPSLSETLRRMNTVKDQMT